MDEKILYLEDIAFMKMCCISVDFSDVIYIVKGDLGTYYDMVAVYNGEKIILRIKEYLYEMLCKLYSQDGIKGTMLNLLISPDGEIVAKDLQKHKSVICAKDYFLRVAIYHVLNNKSYRYTPDGNVHEDTNYSAMCPVFGLVKTDIVLDIFREQ